jgi:hypothetical protein
MCLSTLFFWLLPYYFFSWSLFLPILLTLELRGHASFDLSGYPFFLCGQQVDREKPFSKPNFAILEDSPDPDAKLFAAFGTFKPFVGSL